MTAGTSPSGSAATALAMVSAGVPMLALGGMVPALCRFYGGEASPSACPRGAVTLGLRREDKRRCVLWVRSQGPAIPREELERIFRRFYRADAARSASGSYGLGLSIARGIAAEHRGRIWAESGEEGNTFYLRLPLVKKET